MTILLRLNDFSFATRSQLQAVCDLGEARNANRILARLESDGLIRSIRMHQKIYGLAKEGRELIGVEDSPTFARNKVDHILLCNEVYLSLDQPEDWRTERRMSFKGTSGKAVFIPDADCHYIGRKTFIEVDRLRNMSGNIKKIATYYELQSLYRKNGKVPPIIKFYGICPTRIGRIRRMLSDANVEGTAELIA